MEVVRRRTTARNGAVAASVWDSRMKFDEVKSGIKVSSGEENSEEKMVKRSEKGGGVSAKRKTWKSESSEGTDKSPMQIRKTRSTPGRELCKELGASVHGTEKKPIQIRKTRSDSSRFSANEPCKDLVVSVDGIERTPIEINNTRSDSSGFSAHEPCKDRGVSVDGIERTPIEMKKTRSESNGLSDQCCKDLGVPVDEIEGLSDQCCKDLGVPVDEIERNPKQVSITGSDLPKIPDESCNEFGVCREEIPSSLTNVDQTTFPCQSVVNEDDGVDVAEVDGVENGKEGDMEIMEIEKAIDVKEINTPEQEPKKAVSEEKQLHHIQEKPKFISSIVKKQSVHVIDYPVNNLNPTKPTPIAVSERYERYPETQNKLQSIVDLVMWRDVSKSAFVFGLGSFVLLSSSFTKDLNFSLISAISYLGLLCLAAAYIYNSFLCRGSIDLVESDQIYRAVGEEEAIWLVKLVLPYLNEFLFKLRSLFSGDPQTTMKLALVLFILARCGGSITIWKMAKLGFFGVFTVPKFCASYSNQLAAHGKFWVGRFRDAWDTCSHKKAVAFAAFTLVWNLSSLIARIWAVFMLFVAVRYYHQSFMITEDWTENDAVTKEDDAKRQRQKRGPTLMEVAKAKRDPKTAWGPP